MQYLGFFLVAVALVALIVGILQQMKAKKILAAPFRKTGEIAQNPQVADAKGTVSCEGAMVVQQPLMAPCSGKPCIYYEVELIRSWEKTVQTENGLKTEKGTTSISTNHMGSQIYVNDGSGPVGADFRQDVDCDMEKSFEQMQNVSYGDVVFGQYRAHVPYDASDKRTVGVKAVEKLIPAQGNVFVMGKLAGGVITKQDGMLGKLLASTKGRDKLIGVTKRNALIGFIAGGVSLAGGIPMAIFGDPPHDSCANMKDAWAETCTGHITDDSGNTYDWTVTKPGQYTIEVIQPGVKIPIYPVLTIKTAAGADVAKAGDTTSVGVTQKFSAGTYKINVRDSVKGAPAKFKGGFSFSLKFTGGPAGAPPADSGEPAASGSAEASAAPKAPPPPPPVSHPAGHPSAKASAAPSGKAAAGKAPAGKTPAGKKH
ncbi:MAG: GIDE domain-containing protein [Minicystis sp.]